MDSPPPPYERLPPASQRRPVDPNERTYHLPATEVSPILRSNQRTQQRQTESRPPHRENNQFSLEKFILLWLGIGRWYSVACLLTFTGFFVWGIAVMVVSGIAIGIQLSITSCDRLLPSFVLAILAGILFIAFGGYWGAVYAWNRNRGNNSNFTVLACYAWLLSILFVSVVVATGVELYENRTLLPGFCWTRNCGNCTFQQPSPWELYVLPVVSSSMVAVIVFCLCFSSCLCCVARRAIGTIC